MAALPAHRRGHPPAAILLSALLAMAARAAGAADPAEPVPFHGAPTEAAGWANPLTGDSQAVAAGAALYAQHCAACHGQSAQGSGNVPSLAQGSAQTVPAGELFWFIGHGSVGDGMPSFDSLPEQQRWQVVSYLQSLQARAVNAVAPPQASGSPLEAPPPVPPFTDFRYEVPGATHHITASDLPLPFATQSASNSPTMVARPADAWPKALPGFRVNLYASGLVTPRVIRVAPNGDVFVAESDAGQLRVFRGLKPDGTPARSSVFARGLNRPYGIAFYPTGANPRWVYIGAADAVVRIRYRRGDLRARTRVEHVLDLPFGGGHWTRDLQFSPDGSTLFIAVGSFSNVDDPDTSPSEHLRANILAADPEGTHLRVFASGIRNPSGLAIDPSSGDLWCSVNERDALGDNLVPDYITRVQAGGFYGWPWWYIGAHQDPRHAGKHPELEHATIVPDILLQPHNASLQITFYEGDGFPPEYRGDLFAAEHGSWNKGVRTGYEVIRIPLHQADRPSGEYQDFLTGFVLPSGEVWGRPVGVARAPDGALLVTDDGSNSIWRVSYTAAARMPGQN
jgi:glucose/arabinose dehydrogenase